MRGFDKIPNVTFSNKLTSYLSKNTMRSPSFILFVKVICITHNYHILIEAFYFFWYFPKEGKNNLMKEVDVKKFCRNHS